MFGHRWLHATLSVPPVTGVQSMCPRWSEPMPARHVSYTDKVVDQILRSQSMQRSEDQHRQLELYALRRAQPVKAGERLIDVVWASETSDGSGSGIELRLEMTTQGSRDSDQSGVPVVQVTQYQHCDQRLINRRRNWSQFCLYVLIILWWQPMIACRPAGQCTTVPSSVPSDDHSCWSWTMHDGHVTIWFAIGHFLPVVLWNEAFISMVSEIFNGECNKLIDMTLNDL